MVLDRTRYMSKHEVKQLRTNTEGHALIDLKKGNTKGVLAWMLVDLALSSASQRLPR